MEYCLYEVFYSLFEPDRLQSATCSFRQERQDTSLLLRLKFLMR